MFDRDFIERLNQDITDFPQVHEITPNMKITHEGVSRLVMLDRYAFKDTEKKTLRVGDFVLLTIKEDPKFPARGHGFVMSIDWEKELATIRVSDEFVNVLDDPYEAETMEITRSLDVIEKPLEVFYEQIALRNATGIASVEGSFEKRNEWFEQFSKVLKNLDFVPAGRVLYGAGSGAEVTYFNCFTGDTIVQTKEGPKEIKELKGLNSVYSMGGEIREAYFESYGKQNIFQITLSNGEVIRTTKGHEWFVYDRVKDSYEKVKTIDLVNKRIPIIPSKRKVHNKLELKEGIQHGIVYGDGTSLGEKSTVLLFGEKKELSVYFEGDYPITPHYLNEYVRVYDLPLEFKKLPPNTKSKDYWRGFVMGLIATDGSCDTRGSVILNQSDKKVLSYIADNLYKTGFVHTSIRMTRMLSPFDGTYSPCYALRFAKSSIDSSDLINRKHYENFILSPLPRRTTIEVISVVDLNYSEEVYCCQEPETNSFVVGSGYLTSNCYVMPFIKDSREGISEHRKQVMEIMSRGGGVGTNGSTLRPRNALAKGVNGKSSGAVSWLDDIAKLTHLVEQGGSRRGAQMLMLADWHPDILEFIISKMQNPHILRFLIKNTVDEQIKQLAREKLKFTSLSEMDRDMYMNMLKYKHIPGFGGFTKEMLINAQNKIDDGGTYTVHDSEFLTGANISVTLTKDFMEAVENDAEYELRFPDVENYSQEEMKIYNEKWHEIGDIRDWKSMGYAVKTYRKIKAKELWDLINICATYSAEPGIFFIDNANDMTNAKAYGQKVVATNPCGEQPLAPYSVCNLAAVNLANMANKDSKTVDFKKLKEVVRVGVRMQDNIIDATPYFLPENKKQALGERRVGLGVMGLHDLLIYTETVYGSEKGNQLVNDIFETIATTAYRTSIELAKEKGSFPFLLGETEKETEELRKAFLDTGYMKQMPEDIKQEIMKHGIRNSHLLTVAPTGSTGTMVGVSTGLEPYFSFSYYRSGRLGKFIEVNAKIVDEFLADNPKFSKDTLPAWFVSAMELSPEAHADTQCIIQRWVDSSISKTVNAPKGYTVEQVQNVYERLYIGGAKGGTVYVDGSRDSQVLTLKAEENDTDKELQELKKPMVVIMDTIKELTKTKVGVGSEVGDDCPMCREGKIVEAGGCNTCTACGAQLQCGL